MSDTFPKYTYRSYGESLIYLQEGPYSEDEVRQMLEFFVQMREQQKINIELSYRGADGAQAKKA